jgi:p-aminobenzoyl-glutamate transporter AbgT
VPETAAGRKTLLTRFLSVIERGGNALPHPATLFAIMALLVIVVSGIAAQFDSRPCIRTQARRTREPAVACGLHRIMRAS